MSTPPAGLKPHWTSRTATIVVPRRRQDVIEEPLDDELILVDPRDGNSHRLNQTALLIWRHCDGQTTTRQMAARLSAMFDVDFDGALDHVEQVLALLAKSDLFEATTGP